VALDQVVAEGMAERDARLQDVLTLFYRHSGNWSGVQPVVEQMGKVDITVNVRGGGLSGQAGAIRHGLARALCQFNPEFRGPLKKAGFLTRDARVVGRKKYGQPGARRRFQFSKR